MSDFHFMGDEVPIDDLNACYQRPPINLTTGQDICKETDPWTDEDTWTERQVPDLRPWKQPAAQRTTSRDIALKRVFRDVELRLLSRDPGRGETPYDEMEMLSFASGKLKRYRNSLMMGKDGDPTEVTEAIDYLIMWMMKNEWGNK